MSTITSPRKRPVSHSSAASPSAVTDRTAPRIARRIGRMLLLMVLAGSLLASVPALRPVLRQIRGLDASWLVAGIGLELASCVSFAVLFPLFFDRLQPRDARDLAWTEMASGALLPGGGAGGLAIGGWLIRLTGVPTSWIIRRSGGLFFLTSAVNGAALVGAGLLLAFGVPGPHAFTLTVLPALLASIAMAAVVMLPRVLRSRSGSSRWVAGLIDGVEDAEQAAFQRPSWRLLGALGYLGFDMATLWIVLKGFGVPIGAPALILAYNIGYLANALPIPGSIGVLDAGLAGALLLYGAPAGHVAAAVLVYHAIALWTPGLGGTFAYARLRRRLIAPSAPSHGAPGAGSSRGARGTASTQITSTATGS